MSAHAEIGALARRVAKLEGENLALNRAGVAVLALSLAALTLFFLRPRRATELRGPVTILDEQGRTRIVLDPRFDAPQVAIVGPGGNLIQLRADRYPNLMIQDKTLDASAYLALVKGAAGLELSGARKNVSIGSFGDEPTYLVTDAKGKALPADRAAP